MKLQDKIKYLLNNNYTESIHPQLGRVFVNKSNTKRFTNKDLLLCWDNIEVF